jgi:hypothetical protein
LGQYRIDSKTEWNVEKRDPGGDRSSSKMVVSKRSLVRHVGRKMVWWVGDLPREIRVEDGLAKRCSLPIVVHFYN